MRLPYRTPSRSYSRWAWAAGLAVVVAVAVYSLGMASSTTDSSRLVADAGQIQPLMLDVAAAADAAAATGDPAAADAAIAALDAHLAGLFAHISTQLGERTLLIESHDVESAVAGFAEAARDYASGAVDGGGGGDSFVVATQRIDVLVDAITDWSEARLDGSQAAVVNVIVLLLVGGGLAVVGFWMTGREAGELDHNYSEAMRWLDAISEDLPDIAFQTDAAGVLTFVSEASSTLLGYVPAAMVGLPVYDFASRPAAIPLLPFKRAEGVSLDLDWKHVDGSTRRLELIARPGEGGQGMRGVLRDISDRLTVQEALRESEERFSSMIENAHSGIMVVTADGVRFANVALAELLGRPVEELAGLDVRDLVPPEERERFGSLIANRIWTGAEPVRHEERLLRADGETRDVEMTISPFREQGEVVGALLEVNDITATKLAAAEIQRIAEHDYLTMLPNRLHFERLFAEAIGQAEHEGGILATMLVDLDRFKLVNDTYGHAVGDQLLRDVATRLREIVPDGDVLARFGGDEFLVLLRTIDRVPQAVSIAEMIAEAMAEPFEIDELTLHIGASVGLSLYPHDGEDMEALLHHADAAMYRVKAMGGGAFELATAAQQPAPGQLMLEADLRGAIERCEFVLHYQPIIDSSTRQIVRVEALIRWEHPERGLIPPLSFIPALEKSGLIVEVGEWVLREACEQNRRWQDAGLAPIRVSVNLSPHQLLRADLVDTVQRALADSGLDPQYLELELTETAAMENLDQAITVLNELNDFGVRTVLDDFGTGHSSFARLRDLPVSSIKIDRSFVNVVTEGGDNRAIVTGMIALAHALGISVIGEGVETPAQFRELRSLDCDMVQGFHFARPLPEEASTLLLREGLGDAPSPAMFDVA
ncbi:MAG: EAL domain-containing protein [Dehalococcoidia bacterium]